MEDSHSPVVRCFQPNCFQDVDETFYQIVVFGRLMVQNHVPDYFSFVIFGQYYIGCTVHYIKRVKLNIQVT